jgi:hypothetical protein
MRADTHGTFSWPKLDWTLLTTDFAGAFEDLEREVSTLMTSFSR